MKDLLLLLLILLSMITAKAEFAYHMGCHLFPKISRMDEEGVIDVRIPRQCSYGLIEWHYPRGSLHLHTVRMPGYNFCLEKSWGTWLGAVRDLTTGRERHLNMPRAGKPSCATDLYGRIDLMVDANPLLYFVISFKFRVIYPYLEAAELHPYPYWYFRPRLPFLYHLTRDGRRYYVRI